LGEGCDGVITYWEKLSTVIPKIYCQDL